MGRRAVGLGLAVMLVATSALAGSEGDPEEGDPNYEEARAHFDAGLSFLKDRSGAHDRDALREFYAAYALIRSWKILGYLGHSALKLERDGEARDALKRYRLEAGRSIEPAEREQVAREVEALEASVVTVRLTLPHGVTVLDERLLPNGSTVKNSYGPLLPEATLGVRAGRHRFTAHLNGLIDQVWEVDAAAGGTVTHRFEWLPSPTPHGTASATASKGTRGDPLLPLAFVSVGVGVVGVGLGTAYALEAISGDTRTAELVAFVVGGAGLTTGVTLFMLSGTSESEPGRRAALVVAPRRLGIVGSF